jgi:hypothetical protein
MSLVEAMKWSLFLINCRRSAQNKSSANILDEIEMRLFVLVSIQAIILYVYVVTSGNVVCARDLKSELGKFRLGVTSFFMIIQALLKKKTP